MKKQLSLILAALMLGAALASCGGAQTETPVDTQADTQETGTDTAADTEEVYDPFAGMPEKDYGGYEFTILTRNLDRWTDDMYIAEATGDIVDDAIFDRNSLIEETYNITIVSQRSSDSNSEMDAKTSILADDDAYDIVVPHGRAAFEYAAQGLVLDWNTELPYVNLDNPWWDQDARNSFSINHKLYVMIGDISYCSMGAANVMLFNKQLFNQLDLEYPYQMVRDGKWTFEVFAEMVKDAGADLNGDGEINIKDDRFGYLTQKWVGPVQAFATSGLRVFSKDENDIPYISFMSDKTVDVFNRYFDLLDLDAVYLDDSAVSYVE
ncbi:MAG: extracellular solute-binding protein, partial [Eubacteriales bacterium]